MLSIADIEPESVRKLSRKERAVLLARLTTLASMVAAMLAEGDDDGEDRLITVADAAAMIAQDETWIYKHQARLAFIRKNGRSLRCSLKAVREYMNHAR